MDETERHAAKFLASQGYRDDEYVYEPDGNVPPDFLLQNRIAIEVRRLNQNYEGATRTEGLEEAAIPFSQSLKKLVESFGAPTGAHSWFVNYDFGRPKPEWSSLRPALRKWLADFKERPTSLPLERKFGDTLTVEIMPSSLKFETFYVVGGYTDAQAGGWLVSEMMRNIEICVAEKTRKIAPYKARYPEWWLILIDHIGYGALDAHDVSDIRRFVPMIREWNKVVVVSAMNCSQSFEIA